MTQVIKVLVSAVDVAHLVVDVIDGDDDDDDDDVDDDPTARVVTLLTQVWVVHTVLLACLDDLQARGNDRVGAC